MYNTVLAIQYISIIGLFIEGWIVLRNWNSKTHSYFFFSIITSLFNNVGYLFELTAKTPDAYLAAVKISYFGRTWVTFSLFLFLSELCKIKIPRPVKIGCILFHIATVIIVFTTPAHDLYYKDMEFILHDGYIRMQRTSGIWHKIHSVSVALYIVTILTALFITHHKERDRRKKNCLTIVIIAMLTESAFTIFQLFVPTPFTYIYDLTMPGFAIGTVIMLIAIIRFDLLGTAQLAKDYIVDKMSEGIIAADAGGNIAYFNKPAETLFPELQKNAAEVVDSLREAIQSEKPINIDGRIYTPRTDTLTRGSGVSGTIYVLQDNTELYKHAKELEEMTERANAANRAKSLFLSSMSHEIRTPINAVLGMDEMILRESAEKDTLSYAADIRTAGRTLLSLINDILDFSKIEEGRMEIIPAQYELSSLINDLVNMVKSRADNKGLGFEVNVDPGLPHLLCGDEIRIKQCALNILTNAVKYTEKGSVSFSVGFEREDGEHILLKLCVKDTGIGMKPEDMDKLFSPFSRIEEKRNRSIEGTGLGMSITKQLLALMGTRLEVSSVYGEGSEFSFAVRQKVIKAEPIGDYSARYLSENEHTAYHEKFRAPSALILVVDDTPVNLSVIKGLLKQTQIRVDTAPSGKLALEAAEKTHYDLIFIDHMMPEMDGIETLHRLKELPANSSAMCVALTANAVSGAREMYISEGFDDYLTKPVDSEKLEALLLENLPKEKVELVGDKDEPDGGDIGINASPLPGGLYGIDEIDVTSGLGHNGTPEVYLETLSIYASVAASNADEIEGFWKAHDTENAVIKIHALKSTSRVIGADRLGALAEKLELAGKAGDTDVLAAQIDELIERYRRLGALITQVLDKGGDSGDKPLISDEMLKSSYAEIREFAENFDIDGAALAIEAIAKYTLPEKEKERFARLKEAADNFDWDAVNEIAAEA